MSSFLNKKGLALERVDELPSNLVVAQDSILVATTRPT